MTDALRKASSSSVNGDDKYLRYHRALAIYHLRKWLFPNAKIPIPKEKLK